MKKLKYRDLKDNMLVVFREKQAKVVKTIDGWVICHNNCNYDGYRVDSKVKQPYRYSWLTRLSWSKEYVFPYIYGNPLTNNLKYRERKLTNDKIRSNGS